MKLALENFAQMDVTPKAVILGDMRELGPTSDELHQEVVHQLQGSRFDQILLCGEHFSRTGDGFQTFPTTAALKDYLQAHPLSGFHILLKGSHSMALETLIDTL